MTNSADPDQLEKPTDLDLHCLQIRAYPGSAGLGLTFTFLWANSAYFSEKLGFDSSCKSVADLEGVCRVQSTPLPP